MLHNTIHSINHNLSSEYLIHYINDELCLAFSLDNKGLIEPLPFSFTDSKSPYYFIPRKEMDLFNGDILFFSPRGYLRTIFTLSSSDNVLFVTNQCNNRCLMCSQPPTTNNDINFYFNLNKTILHRIPCSTSALGITGGEPTLLKNRLLDLIDLAYQRNSTIGIHVLTNGRAFANKHYASLFERYNTRDFVLGIPLHSDYEMDHNLIAGNSEAYNQTLLGLYNLALYQIGIEIRIVINRINYQRLPQIAAFIFKNFPFVLHVTFMGIEYTGFMIKNSDIMWIDPTEYIDYLEKAVCELSEWNMNVSIYNLPLCLLKPSLYKFAVKSISDWKEVYLKECDKCLLKNNECGGVFSTSKIQSKHIKAFV